MKITSVRAFPVRVPIHSAPYGTQSAGTKIEWGRRSRITPKRPTPILDYVLVRLETDEGLVGWGEGQPDVGFFGETSEQVAAAIDDYLGLHLIGMDPLDREWAMNRIDFRENGCTKSALDMALHDLIGKSLGVSVASLLGGMVRSRVPVAVEIAGGDPDGMANECIRLMGLGVRAFKAKIGGDPERDAERLAAIRQAVGPAVSLRADANQGYSPKEAIRLCRLAERRNVGLELLEQPVLASDLPGMALVRNSVETPIEADESCFTVQDAVAIVRQGAADVLNVKLGKAGGFLAAKKIMAVAEGAGLRCVIGTSFGLGLEIAAKLHLYASSPIAVDAVEFTELVHHGNRLQPPHDASLALPLTDGCLIAPTGPGLGVQIADPLTV